MFIGMAIYSILGPGGVATTAFAFTSILFQNMGTSGMPSLLPMPIALACQNKVGKTRQKMIVA